MRGNSGIGCMFALLWLVPLIVNFMTSSESIAKARKVALPQHLGSICFLLLFGISRSIEIGSYLTIPPYILTYIGSVLARRWSIFSVWGRLRCSGVWWLFL